MTITATINIKMAMRFIPCIIFKYTDDGSSGFGLRQKVMYEINFLIMILN